MSYARFGKDSDVYVFQSTAMKGDRGRRFVCYGGHSKSKSVRCLEHCDVIGFRCTMDHGYGARTRKEMLQHLRWHRKQGDRVPARAFSRLLEEIRDPGAQRRQIAKAMANVRSRERKLPALLSGLKKTEKLAILADELRGAIREYLDLPIRARLYGEGRRRPDLAAVSDAWSRYTALHVSLGQFLEKNRILRRRTED